MEENENNETNQTADNAGTGDAAGGTNATPVVDVPVEKPEEKVIEPPAAVVVPDGYVKAEDVETERTARTLAETARTEAETRATAAEARVRETEIKAAAQALNFHDPADALTLIGADVEDVSAALAEVLKTKSYLAKQAEVAPVVTPTSPTNPARSTATLTLESMKGMTPQQLAGQWPAVMAALKANQ